MFYSEKSIPNKSCITKPHISASNILFTKVFLSLLLFFGLPDVSMSQNINFSWAKGIGASGEDLAKSIVVDPSGNTYTTGHFKGSVDFDPGSSVFTLTSSGAEDIFILKLNALGNFIWAKRLGGTGEDVAYSIALDQSGNIGFTGIFNDVVDFDPGASLFNLTTTGMRDIFVSKLDPNGNFLWAKQMGGINNEFAYAIGFDAAGNVFTTGHFFGTADFDPGPAFYNFTSAGDYDNFISKLDPNGNFLWAKQIGSITGDISAALDIDAGGNIYTTGSNGALTDFDPGTGVFNLPGPANFILKLDNNGNFVFAKGFATVGFGITQAFAIKLAADGSIYSSGGFTGTIDFDPGAAVYSLSQPLNNTYDIYISKLNAIGDFIWAKQMTATTAGLFNSGRSMVIDNSGNVYTTGLFGGPVDFDPGAGSYNLTSFGGADIFLSSLDASGNFVSARQLGGNGSDFGNGLTIETNGNIYVAGQFSTTADFEPCPGTYNLSSSGSWDIFAAKFSLPSITIYGPTSTVCAGTPANFGVALLNGTGSGANYQWQVNGINAGTNLPIFTSTTLNNNDQVKVIVTFVTSCIPPETATSNIITVSVNVSPVAAVSISTPSSSVCVGTVVTFTATPINGGATPTYQWQVNSVNTGPNSPTFTTNTLSNADIVKVFMTSALSCATGSPATSNSISMTVSQAGAAAVNIISTGTSICSGTSVTFTATPTNGGGTPTFQWQINGVNAGANLPTFSSNTLANGDIIKVIMTSSSSCATGSPITSNTITMSVTQSLVPSVSISGNTTTICAGSGVIFTATSTNGGINPGYQWQVNGVNTGSNSPVFLTSLLNNGDIVNCMLTSNYPCVTTPTALSNSLQIIVNTQVIPSVIITASSTTICTATTVTFTAIPINGGLTPAFQWRINGINTGSNSASFVTNAIANGDLVSCIITNLNSCSPITTAVSNNILMTVSATAAPSLSIIATANDICPYTPITFTAIPLNPGTPRSFQWKLNGTNVGSNIPSYSGTNFANGDKINCIMNTATGCSASPFTYSDTIKMIIRPVPVIAFNPANPTIASGSAVQINTSVTGNPLSFLWTPVSGLNNPSIQNPIAGPLVTTVYNLKVVDVNTCYADKDITVTIFKDIYIPNSFTPDGNNINDVFRIPAGTTFSLKSFSIFDRYGNMVFNTTDINKGWDGNFKGVKSPNGCYVYLIRGSDSKGEVILNGTVLIFR